jgi:hypothetical protein
VNTVRLWFLITSILTHTFVLVELSDPKSQLLVENDTLLEEQFQNIMEV